MEWPRERLNVYCMDDKGRPEVEALATASASTTCAGANKGETKKAGNIVYAYNQTDGEHILVFDAN